MDCHTGCSGELNNLVNMGYPPPERMPAINLASNIYLTDVAEDPSLSVVKILTWLLAHIGDLNTRLSTTIYVQHNGNDFCPQLTYAQAGIYGALYLYNYYLQQARINGNAAAYAVTVVKEGDSSISVVNKNEVAKTFRGLASDMLLNVNKLCLMYRQNSALPVSINNPFIGMEYWAWGGGLYNKQAIPISNLSQVPIPYT